jgi:cation transport regulator ChaB
MTNEENIYSRLLDGESADDIAKAFTEALNAAVEQYEEAERQRIEEETAKAKAARESRAAAKKSAMIDLVNAFLYFIGEYYPSFGFTVEDVDAMDDEAIYALADLFIGILDMEQAMPSKRNFKMNGANLFKPTTAKEAVEEETAKRDIFKEAFKMFGL